MHAGRISSADLSIARVVRVARRVAGRVMSPVWIVLVVLLRAVRPLWTIRLGGINAGRLGHLVMDLEMFCSERQAGVHSRNGRTSDVRYVWTSDLPVCNPLLLELWRPKFLIGPRWILQPLDTWNRRLPGGEANAIPYRKGPTQLNQHNDLHDVLRRTGTQLPCPPQLVSDAVREIRRIRPQFDPFGRYVCVHVRDEAYFARWGDSPLARDGTRNASIHTYTPAISHLLERGFSVIRLGASTTTPLDLDHPQFWDYAADGSRSELLDIVLPRHCHFFISTLSGPDKLAQAYRRPILFTNLAPLKSISLWMQNSLIAPKRFRRDDGSTIPWRDVFGSGLYTKSESELAVDGIRLAHNTPSELLDSTREMTDRLAGITRDDARSDSRWAEMLNYVPAHLRAGGVRSRWATALLDGNGHQFENTNS